MIGMAIIIVIAIIGAARKKRGPLYWPFCIGAALYFGFIAPFLFSAHGTLETPQDDGIITRAVRAATNDGPWMGLWAFVILFGVYGGTAALLGAALRDKPKLL